MMKFTDLELSSSVNKEDNALKKEAKMRKNKGKEGNLVV